MVRFLGHGGPKVCEILHLAQLGLSKEKLVFLKEKKRRAKKTRKRDTRVVSSAFESY